MRRLTFTLEPRRADRPLAYLPDRVRASSGALASSRGCVVPGTLVEADDVEVASLEEVVVLTTDGGARRAHVVVESALGDSVGASTEQVPRGIFVYGTLRAGEERHASMLRIPPTRAVDATIRGALVDLGEYPGLVPAASPEQVVLGELYEYEDPRDLLPELDAIEDFFGYDLDGAFCVAGSLYRRSLVDVPTAEGATLAWTYVYVGGVEGTRIVPGGDWKRSR